MPCSPSARLRWLGSGREKVEYFRAATTLRVERAASSGFRRGAEKTIRLLPGQAADRRRRRRPHARVPVLVNRTNARRLPCLPTPSRRAAEGLARVGLRLLVPRHMVEGGSAVRGGGSRGDEPALRLDDAAELRWFFRQQDQVDRGVAPDDYRRFRRACRTFRAPRYHVLYRLWKKNGDQPVECHGLAGPGGQDRATQRPRDQRGAFPCLCTISHPWLAQRSPADGRTEGGTQAGRSVPLLVAPARSRSVGRRQVASRSVCPHVVEGEQLSRQETRGVFCRASVRRQSTTTVEWQPGRERPPLCQPRIRSRGRSEGGRSRPGSVSSSVRTNGSEHASSTQHGASSASGPPVAAHSASRGCPP